MYLRHDTLYGRPNGRGIIVPKAAVPVLALDRARPKATSAWKRSKKLETSYAARLRKVAKHIADIVREFPEGTIEAATLIRGAMERYSHLLQPWAEAVAGRMIAEADARDDRTWKTLAGQMGRALQREIATAPTGNAMREILADQVGLITSLPIEAAERVHKLTLEGITQGRRAADIVPDIMRTGEVTRSRATLIARTETARTASVLTQVRAEHIGSTHYQWVTAGDGDVRSSHRKLNGKVFAWNDPPECDPGHHAHPGQIWNCRCIAIPIIP